MAITGRNKERLSETARAIGAHAIRADVGVATTDALLADLANQST